MPKNSALVRLQPSELEACNTLLREGSKSFSAAALLLPQRMRAPAAAVYAFCRVADDAVDEGDDPQRAADELLSRLQRIYDGRPDDDVVDRAFSTVVRAFDIPRAVPALLLEGFVWDAQGRAYESLEDLEAYCVRVASTVGVMMTLLMGPREPEVLARACDLGIAMQLTNICRDVGEDARNGRIYLPRQWLRDAGIEPQALLAEPRPSAALAAVVERLLRVADDYYRRADLGITMLPSDSRLAIRAARLIYADIGRVIANNGYNSISQRAVTSKARKLWLLLRAFGARLWRRRCCDAPGHAAARDLIIAAGDAPLAAEAA